MAAVSRRPHPLHNFSLPSLKWGNQRNLRCGKGKANGDKPSAAFRSSSSYSDSEDYATHASGPLRAVSLRRPVSSSSLVVKSGSSADADAGIKKVRQKLLAHLDAVGARVKERDDSPEADDDSSDRKACNSKKRRAPAPCSAPIEVRGRVSGAEDGVVKSDAPPPSLSRPKSLRLRGLAPALVIEENKVEIPTLSVSLSKQEIEDDFLAMTGLKPPRRPKKRPRAIQNKLNETFPGLWLCDITPDSYKIPDDPESRKN